MPMGKLRDISPGILILDYGDSPHENLYLDKTLGTSKINVLEGVADVHEERFGDAPVDTVSKGTVVTIDWAITRPSTRDLKEIFPNKFDIQSGNELILKNCAGYAYFENSVPAVVVPIVCDVPSTDRSEWVYFWHVHPVMSFELGYDRDGQRTYQTQFKVYPVQTPARFGQLCKVGV